MVQGVVIEQGCIVDVNPATGAVIERVPVTTKEQLDAAVAAARAAQMGWAAVSLPERTALVKEAVTRIGIDRAGLARSITMEMGKILKEAEEEVDDNANKDEYCDLVRAANEPEIHGSSVIVRHPHGVVSICSPWNFPVEEIVLLSIPALIAGNAIVVKPSEVVPLSSGAVVRCLMEAFESTHPGLVHLVQGDGAVGAALVNHPGVDMCAMTGSTATGAKILQCASSSLKPVVVPVLGHQPRTAGRGPLLASLSWGPVLASLSSLLSLTSLRVRLPRWEARVWGQGSDGRVCGCRPRRRRKGRCRLFSHERWAGVLRRGASLCR